MKKNFVVERERQSERITKKKDKQEVNETEWRIPMENEEYGKNKK